MASEPGDAIAPGEAIGLGVCIPFGLGLGVAQFALCIVLCTMLSLALGEGHGDAVPTDDDVVSVGGVWALATKPTAPASTNAPAITALARYFIRAAYP